MVYRKIEIPGGDTTIAEGPWIHINGIIDEPINFTVKYQFDTTPDLLPIFGEVIFTDVFEYRWISEHADYDDFPIILPLLGLGLYEMVDSPYVENLLSKGPLRERKEKRFGDVIDEAELRLFMFPFADYGTFHIISLGVTTIVS